jgi:predicted esterase
VVVPQSSQRDADGYPTWDELEIAHRDIGLAVADAKAVAAGDVPVVFGGASQGASVAMRFALEGSPVSSPGFIAVVGTADPSSIEPSLEGAANRGVRGVMFGGGDDRLSLGWQRSAHDELARRGIPIQFEEVPGLGHWYPDDFDQRLQRGLDFLLID